ncbi:unnamed protein product, partial [marine sediment metagenome]
KIIQISDFDVIISRDTPVKPKPSGEGIRLAAKTDFFVVQEWAGSQ